MKTYTEQENENVMELIEYVTEAISISGANIPNCYIKDEDFNKLTNKEINLFIHSLKMLNLSIKIENIFGVKVYKISIKLD